MGFGTTTLRGGALTAIYRNGERPQDPLCAPEPRRDYLRPRQLHSDTSAIAPGKREIPKFGRLALRLQLDNIKPRSHGGHDYRLSNIRTTCRLCNHGRFKLSETLFRAELLSRTKSVCAPIRMDAPR